MSAPPLRYWREGRTAQVSVELTAQLLGVGPATVRRCVKLQAHSANGAARTGP